MSLLWLTQIACKQIICFQVVDMQMGLTMEGVLKDFLKKKSLQLTGTNLLYLDEQKRGAIK